MKNITKILIIALVSLFAIGIMMGTAEASHTFKKGGYKMKVTDKQYKKLKNSKSYDVVKKVGTKTVKTYKYKTVKTETSRDYYYRNGDYRGWKVYTHHDGYWSNINARLVGCYHKKVTHYNSDGSYYVDTIEYEKWRFTKKTKKNVYMHASKNYDFFKEVGLNPNKIYVDITIGTPYFCY